MNFTEDMKIPGSVDNIRCIIDQSVLSEEDMTNMAIVHGPVTLFDRCTITYLVNRESMEIISCEYIPMKPSGGTFGSVFAASKIYGVLLNQSNIRSVLTITLKVNRKQYCGNLRKWTGMGFHYAIHQPNKPMPLFVLSHFELKLHGGYMFEIGIK
uniref:Uncharacterized protein n=1 Tax=Romanomermis culicivorax TaxID=13658 RepID=A0A915L215_ROMCU